jgi:hypothetical protein
MKRNVWAVVVGLGLLACAGPSSTAQGPCEAYFDACVKSPPDARPAFLAQCHLDVNGPGRERLGPRLSSCAEAAREAPAACGEAACATPPGTLSGGAACVENEQCESKCQEKLVVGAGSACGSESVRCDVGLVCVRGGDRAYCAAPVLRGGACTPERTAPCEAHTICLRGKCDVLDPSACR